jgi:MoxR-like ATPase
MTLSDSRQDLGALLASRTPLIVIESRDESRVLDLITSAASGRAAYVPLPVFRWTVTDGLSRLDVQLGTSQIHNAPPTVMLKSIRDTTSPGVYVLLDFHPFLDDPVNVRMLKDICQGYNQAARTLVLVSYEVHLPAELDHLAARFDVAFPGPSERRVIVDRVAAEWTAANARPVSADARSIQLLVENLGGLSFGDVERLAHTAIFDDGALLQSDLPAVTEAKREILGHDGVLTFDYDTVPISDVAGMARLKSWLTERRAAFDGTAPELQTPRGVLLLGVQGCGKSVAAKAAAGVFGVPLLRLDMASLYDKYVGESKRNLRETLASAELLAPCVVWIDEIEKGSTATQDDSGTSQRLLGTFLTWLAEKTTKVFVVATANDISALPPELVRKGRFDEIFFVDLPTAAVRAEILRIHASRRGVQIADADLDTLAAATTGFSGAEIEQAIVSATYAAHALSEPVVAAHILAEVAATRPLSVIMAERIDELRRWAAMRTVSAD